MSAIIKSAEQYPIDSDGFAESYDNPHEWCEIMQRYNVLIVQILNDEECKDIEHDLWESVGPTVTADYCTWETENWPDPKSPFLNSQYITTEKSFLVRTHPKLVKVFETLYGTNEILTTADFYGIKRATVLPNGICRKDWRNKPLRLHWDVDILEYVQDKKQKKTLYQSLIAINDNTQDVGSFACVPGSANLLNEWLSIYKKPENTKYVPNNNPWQKQIQRLCLRKGCVVIWDRGTAHANFTNYSCYPRLTMYCRMIPKKSWAINRDRQAIVKYWNDNPEKNKK